MSDIQIVHEDDLELCCDSNTLLHKLYLDDNVTTHVSQL